MVPNLIRWGGPALMLGGLLWVLTYLVEIMFGMTAGEAAYISADVSASILVWLWGVFGEATANDGLGFLGVIGTLGGSLILGIATLRVKVLPRWARFVLMLTPFAFVPAIIVTIPLDPSRRSTWSPTFHSPSSALFRLPREPCSKK